MIRAVALMAAIAIVVVSGSARAESDQQINVNASTGWTIIGTNPNHFTGGFTPRVTIDYSFGSPEMDFGIGADFAVFGFGGDARWIGILGGPIARVGLKPFEAPFRLEFTASADFGRIAECTAWEHPICPRFVGFFPAGRLAGYYSKDGFSIGAFFAARIVNTMVGTSGSYEPGIAASLAFGRK